MDASDILELYNERVAIMTIDGEQSEFEAVRHAYFMCRDRFGRSALPQRIVDDFARVMHDAKSDVNFLPNGPTRVRGDR